MIIPANITSSEVGLWLEHFPNVIWMSEPSFHPPLNSPSSRGHGPHEPIAYDILQREGRLLVQPFLDVDSSEAKPICQKVRLGGGKVRALVLCNACFTWRKSSGEDGGDGQFQALDCDINAD